MRVMVSAALKKIENEGGKMNEDGTTVPASASKKRKATSNTGQTEGTPSGKKRGRKAKQFTPVQDGKSCVPVPHPTDSVLIV